MHQSLYPKLSRRRY